ncbi:MAG TPA: helix-turn-helix transcriptional regulator [Armatimonadota bacterium]|nr:helix-turn-helix transcriptional regulator [Armatimonadota bacterium]
MRRLRTNVALSQESLAAVCGLHRTYVGAIERGEKTMTIETAGKLARVPWASARPIVCPARSIRSCVRYYNRCSPSLDSGLQCAADSDDVCTWGEGHFSGWFSHNPRRRMIDGGWRNGARQRNVDRSANGRSGADRPVSEHRSADIFIAGGLGGWDTIFAGG